MEAGLGPVRPVERNLKAWDKGEESPDQDAQNAAEGNCKEESKGKERY